MAEKLPLIVLAGPTAVGKTHLSIRLAKHLGAEIISADSMQVYKHMDIGSAKIRPAQMEGVRHHMLDILEPDEEFNVVIFKTRVTQCIREITDRGHIPILTGGTGFYIQAVLYDIDFTENEENTKLRTRLERLYDKKGAQYLHHMLRKADEASAQAIHANNKKRVVRALEFYFLTGKKISEHNETERQKLSAYDSCYFVLNDDRKKLYERIDRRVDDMLSEGLLAEVNSLKEAGFDKNLVSMQGLGYKELLRFLNGEIGLEEAVYLIKRDTRHFAKRQITWFKREKDVIWVEKGAFGYDEEEILAYIIDRWEHRKDCNFC